MRTLAAPSLVCFLSACGSGTAALLSGDDGGSGTTPALTAFAVANPKVSPTMLELEANVGVGARLSYALPGAPEAPMMALDGASGGEVQLPPGTSALSWDFAAELGSTRYEPVVDLFVRHPNGALVTGGALRLGIGNDPPVVLSVEPMPTDPSDPSESSGNVEVRLAVSDSSSDVVAILVEWRRASDAPDAWTPATAAGVFPAGVKTDPDGVEVSFFWNTSVDLADGDDDVLLRVTADDGTLDADGEPVGVSAPVVSALLHVDNNEEPVVQLLNETVLVNPDERRGIPVLLRVFDTENDPVDVLLQWRTERSEFPSLDRDSDGNVTRAEVEEILADPLLRREHRVCTPFPSFAEGLVVPLDASSVRLPELASHQAWAQAGGLGGRSLELLRPRGIPRPVTSTWVSNPLATPIAISPLGEGPSALVLDVPGAARLREIDLATGAVLREIAAPGPGLPSAMALDSHTRAALLALDDAGTWRIVRVELSTGAVTELVVSAGAEPAPVRGITCAGPHTAFFTAGSSLWKLDHHDPLAPRLARLLTGLATPWGVVVDPRSLDRLFVAERDANRVLAIELDSLRKSAVVVRDAALATAQLDAPEALALEGGGTRLLAVTQVAGGGQQIVGVSLEGGGDGVAFSIGDPSASGIGSLATGPAGLRLAALSSANELLVAGGVEQRRIVAAHSTITQAVTVETHFSPAPRPGQPWRLLDGSLRGTVQGAQRRLVWDSTEAAGGPVFLRAIAYDSEIGLPADAATQKSLRIGLDVAPQLLGPVDFGFRPTAADLDADGDLDLVGANEFGNQLEILFQESPRRFAVAPQVLGGFPMTTRPRAVIAADLDGDGDLDVASANAGDTGIPGSLTVFLQTAPGTFQVDPLVLDHPGVAFAPFSLEAVDLDLDGDQDLIAGNLEVGGGVMIYRQLSPGSFQSAPSIVESGITSFSIAVRDLDSDGLPDLVTLRHNANEVAVLFQDTPGSFASPLVLGGTGVTDLPVSVAVADLDSDGDEDLAVANSDGRHVAIFFQSSPRRFLTDPLVLEGAGLAGFFSLAAADMDGDGDQDLVSTGSFEVEILLQHSPGAFLESPVTLAGGFGVVAAATLVPADLDSDGRTDLVAGRTLYFQNGPGRFDSAPDVLARFPDTPAQVVATDLDSDADQDLLALNFTSSPLVAHVQTAPGKLVARPFDVVALSPIAIAVADLDGDGDQDLAVADFNANQLSVHFRSASGTFDSDPLVLGGPGTTEQPFGVLAADFDQDGDQDLVSINSASSNLTIFFQVASGQYDPTPRVLGGPGITDFLNYMIAADLDSDGDQDLVAVTTGTPSLNVFLQTAPGAFDPPRVVGAGVLQFPTWTAAADLDSDGDSDLLVQDNGLISFLQDAAGDFVAAPLAGGPAAPDFSVQAVADVDSDGDPDLVGVLTSGAGIAIYRQVSPGRFLSAPELVGVELADTATGIIADDVDHDGDLDLVAHYASGSFADTKLVVLWGGR